MFHVKHIKEEGDFLQINIFQVDAFTDKSFGGNPAGVVPNANLLNEEQMQNIAREMNLSETAFVTPINDELFKVRFFTPICEVDLCGHATIAAFFIMAKKGYIKPIENGIKTVFQKTKVGKLAVNLKYVNGKIDKVFMEQANPKDFGKVLDIGKLLYALGIEKGDIGINEEIVDPEIISTGLPDIILPISKKEVLDNLKIDMELLAEVSEDNNVIGLHAFYLPDFNSKIVYTRNFAPLVGINEEAATGTSNGALIYFLKKNRLIKDNEILAYQGQSMNRLSEIYCSIDDDNLVNIGGKAKTIIDGIMCL